ncbi:hypothetical protein [Micropruina sonneratiae]|uniref:hypothetical protein n=1 Tax=Micropruina sonneratiae TaxID=2986940 RepID=UPI002225EB84|nr:hypothetical protein [Micropruina sp. KQZ13P-5]MCW3156433.1 hypothetical protein [Micropruina sp. KQZ13P-5]
MAKKRAHKRTTLALVESPAQLLNVIEWAYRAKALKQTRLAVLPPREATTRVQLEAMVELARDAGLAATWYEPRRSAASMVAVAWELFPRLARAERLVVGDPFSRFVQAVLPLADVAQVVVVDDGTATISFIDQLSSGGRLARWHVNAGRDGRDRVVDLLSDLARDFFTPSQRDGRSVEVFTAMPVRAPQGIGQSVNDFAWTRATFGPPAVTDSVDVIGTSLVETGVVDAGRYLAGVLAVTNEFGAGRYFAHRREAEGKLAALAASTGLTVVRPAVPLEIAVRRGPVSRLMVSYPSTVAHTLPLVLADVAVDVAVADVPAAWLLTGAPAGAGDFLATVTATARSRHGLV